MIDRYGRKINYIRISVTELCNLRCRYCMPEEGVAKRAHNEMMTAEETIEAARAAVSLGIDKIRITGGEPLVKRGIVKLCREIAEIEGLNELCITTNGTLLKEFAKPLKEAGVDRINISLDTLKPEKYYHITRMGNLQDALDGLEAALEAGFEKIKINVVLMGGFNDDEIEAFVALTEDRSLEVRFIELMPMGGSLELEKGSFISCDTVLERVPELVPLDENDGVAAMYHLPHAKGRVGLIRPVSCHFCHQCNKIRLTADGMLKPCLHREAELSIRGKDRKEMEQIMEKAIMDKPQMRGELDVENPSRSGRNMNRIGG